MTAALLSLGSNMGDSRRYLADAVAGLGAAVTRVSSVYRTPPWGPVAQDDFLNIAVAVGDDAVDAHGWWHRAQGLERTAARVRDIRWGPRTLDVDVIAVWEAAPGTGAALAGAGTADAIPVLSEDPALILPHPRAHERGFVLMPWAEIQPDAVLAGHGPVAKLLAAVDTSGIERVGRLAH